MRRFFLLTGLLSACVTVGKAEAEKPPVLSTDMTPMELSDAAIRFGDKTLDSAKEILQQKRAWNDVHAYVEKRLRTELRDFQEPEVLNALVLYQVERKETDPNLVFTLLKDDRVFVRKAGWRLAARYPSREMAKALESFVTATIVAGEEDGLLVPEMADAARAHNLHGFYTLMRRGLMAKGDPAFAEAMRAFDPQSSARDFLDYLGRADIDDLRQLHQRNVNLATCLLILQHLASQPLEVTHPKVEALYLFAVSRNQALQEYAGAVLEKNLPAHEENLALVLARLPVSIQVAFVESARRHASPNMNLFLNQLKRVSAHREVTEEIEAVAN